MGSHSHSKDHTIASHSDTTGTGAELEELTDGSETTLHSHAADGGIWTLFETLSPSGVNTISTSTLDVHDLWMVIVDITVTNASEADFRLRLNGDTGNNYVHRRLDADAVVTEGAGSSILLGSGLDHVPTTGVFYVGGKSRGIDGAVIVYGGVVGWIDLNMLTNGKYDAAADITSMTFFEPTFTGKIKIYFMDY